MKSRVYISKEINWPVRKGRHDRLTAFSFYAALVGDWGQGGIAQQDITILIHKNNLKLIKTLHSYINDVCRFQDVLPSKTWREAGGKRERKCQPV